MNEEYRSVYDEVAKCNRCGFCQAHCPIFELTGDERNVARGHNVHVRKLAEGDLAINPDFKDPLFECLLCKACVANCFPAVRTDKAVIAGRAEYLRRVGQPRVMRFLFHRLLPNPRKMARFMRLAALGKNSGMAGLARALGILNWFGKDLDKVEGIVERLPGTFFRDRARALRPASPPADVTAAYFLGCGFNFVLPEVSEATLAVLAESGAAVRLADNCCCGLPAYGYGDLEAARLMARINIEALEKTGAEVVVTECGSCSAFLKDYPELFADDPAWRKRAEALNRKVRAFSEFMLDRLPAPAGLKVSAKITYHDPCHMSRYQKVVAQPRALLKKIPGVTYMELPEADRCCGAAGSYNVLHYEQSMRVLERKMANVKKSEAEIVATECPGCLIQLRYGARRAGLKTRIAHISEIVRESLGGKEG